MPNYASSSARTHPKSSPIYPTLDPRNIENFSANRSITLHDVRTKNFYFYYHVIEIVLGAIFLLPLRLLALFCLIIYTVLVILMLKIIGFPKPSEYNDPKRKPLFHDSPTKKFITFWAVWLAWRSCLFIFGVYWVSISGYEHLSKDAKIFVCAPHSTLWDVMHPSVGLGRYFVCLSRKENDVGNLFKALYFLFVDRDQKDSRKNVVIAQKHRLDSSDWSNFYQCIAPTGTVDNGKSLSYFNKGPFMPGVPVQPVVIEFPEWIDVLTTI